MARAWSGTAIVDVRRGVSQGFVVPRSVPHASPARFHFTSATSRARRAASLARFEGARVLELAAATIPLVLVHSASLPAAAGHRKALQRPPSGREPRHGARQHARLAQRPGAAAQCKLCQLLLQLRAAIRTSNVDVPPSAPCRPHWFYMLAAGRSLGHLPPSLSCFPPFFRTTVSRLASLDLVQPFAWYLAQHAG